MLKKVLLKVSKNFDAKISFANLKVLQVLVFKLSLKRWQIEKGIVLSLLETFLFTVICSLL